MASRLRRLLFAASVVAVVPVPAAVPVPANVPAPAPAPASVAPLESATRAVLAERYATTRKEIQAAARMAAAHGDQARATTLRTLAGPAYQFLAFDGRDGGRTAEVVGDLARARRIGVLVPGASTNLDTYQRFRNGALALHRELGDRSAVIAWLGYRTPPAVGLELLTTATADRAAPGLQTFVHGLTRATPGVPISLLCHSYGSVVCARAAAGLPTVANIVLYGSPGTGYNTAEELRTRAKVWAGIGTGDWIRRVPHARLGPVGFGPDPTAPEFGARVFLAGDGGHSDYLKAGSEALATLARIVTGEAA